MSGLSENEIYFCPQLGLFSGLEQNNNSKNEINKYKTLSVGLLDYSKLKVTHFFDWDWNFFTSN